MREYTVISGQNIFDVALTLYGSVEGVFDLLVSNEGLGMDTELKRGMKLNYNEEFVINDDIAAWLADNDIKVRNGNYRIAPPDVEEQIKSHIVAEHPEIAEELKTFSTDERNIYWAAQVQPRMTVRESGQYSSMTFALKAGTHLIIDWGDFTNLEIYEGAMTQQAEHCYKSGGEHIIRLYGDFSFRELDFRELNGVYYPLTAIVAGTFKSNVRNAENNKLMVTS